MIVYIHGASATAESFTHIRQFVRDKFEEPDIMLEYKSSDGFEYNLNLMKGKLDEAERLFFISHSLGGIYSLFLANHYKETTKGGITLSTPYAGSEQADFARYFLPFNQLMKDVGTMSIPITEALALPAPPNWSQIITTVGDSPWIQEPNDGVVTLKSMKSRTDIEQIEIDLNHYEVVISDRVVEIIIDRISKAF